MITHSPDRLGRSVAIVSNIIQTLMLHKVGIYVASLHIDSRTPGFHFHFSFMKHFEEQFASALSEKVHHAQLGALHRGGAVGGRC